MLKMVDVYSGSPRWFATQAGTDITMVKATQGTGYVNPYCDIDYQAAKKAGKLLGVYHYCSGGNSVAEANYFVNNIKNYVGETVLAVDWEGYQNSSWGNYNYVRQFVNRVHELTGVWCMIYVSQSEIRQVANCVNDCPLWVAYYKYSQPLNWNYLGSGFNIEPWEVFTVHQFTGSDMDRNMVNTTKEGWLKMANPKSTVSIPKPSPEQPKEEHKDAKQVSFVDDLGDTWFKEDGKFTLSTAVNLRYGARTTSDIIVTLPAGSTIKYDAFSRHAGYVWIRQPRENGYGYMAVRDAQTNKPYGTFE